MNKLFPFVILFVLIVLSAFAIESYIPRLAYFNNAALSDQKGIPTDSTVYYFPVNYFKDTIHGFVRHKVGNVIPIAIRKDTMQVRIDSSRVQWYSRTLYLMKEPILYNYYLNQEIYRFTWLRSFAPPVCISLSKKGSLIHLQTKMLKDIPIHHREVDEEGQVITDERYKKMEFQINQTKTLSPTEWKNFNNFLKKYNFWNRPILQKLRGSDGEEWILESHQPDGYYVVNRWSPNESREKEFKELCEYLINLSEIHN